MFVGKPDAAVAFAAAAAQEVDLELVLAVPREVMLYGHSSARTEWQALDVVVLLDALSGHTVFVGLRRRHRSQGCARHAPRNGQVLLEPRLTDLQDARDIVE